MCGAYTCSCLERISKQQHQLCLMTFVRGKRPEKTPNHSLHMACRSHPCLHQALIARSGRLSLLSVSQCREESARTSESSRLRHVPQTPCEVSPTKVPAGSARCSSLRPSWGAWTRCSPWQAELKLCFSHSAGMRCASVAGWARCSSLPRSWAAWTRCSKPRIGPPWSSTVHC